MKSHPEKPQLSLQAYYGFNSDLANEKQIKAFTIKQVFERGTSGDISEIFRVYGQDDVVKVIKSANQLSLRAVKLAKTVLHIPDSEFAFNRRPDIARGTSYRLREVTRRKAARKLAQRNSHA